MKSTLSKFAVLSTMAAAMFFTSCGKKDTAVSLTEELGENLVAFAETMATVKDKESAEAAAKKIDGIDDEVASIGKRMEALEGDPSEEDTKKIQEIIGAAEDKMDETMSNIDGSVMANAEVGKIMGEAMKSFTEKTKDAKKVFEKYEKKD